jgi:phosphoribosylformylglycinamidine cyclo-ligase
MTVSYRDAGVDLDASDELTSWLSTRIGVGLFGGCFPVPELKSYDVPVLVSSVDGIGTKVKLAAQVGRFGGLGMDIVHHCVNDIAAHGAKPLIFMDYLAFHSLDTSIAQQIVESITDACSALGIRLAGGETAEMPLVYQRAAFDVAGAIVGVVEQDQILDGSGIRAGDVLLGCPSSGLHTNGFSLVLSLFNAEDYSGRTPVGKTLAEVLLEPHRCYVDEIQSLIRSGLVKGFAPITGGGIPGNLARILPEGVSATVFLPPPPPVFDLIEGRGVDREEMIRVFNMGVGLIAVCDPRIKVNLPELWMELGAIEPLEHNTRRVKVVDG